MTRDPKLDLAFATVMRRLKTETGSTYGEIAEDAKINSATVRNYCRKAPDSVHVIRSMMDFFGDGIGDFFVAVVAEHEKNR
jgi:predicted transcriptional regulator